MEPVFQNVATRKVHPLSLTVTWMKLFTSGNRAVCRTAVLNKDGKAGAGQGKEEEYNIIGSPSSLGLPRIAQVLCHRAFLGSPSFEASHSPSTPCGGSCDVDG